MRVNFATGIPSRVIRISDSIFSARSASGHFWRRSRTEIVFTPLRLTCFTINAKEALRGAIVVVDQFRRAQAPSHVRLSLTRDIRHFIDGVSHGGYEGAEDFPPLITLPLVNRPQ